MKNLFRIILIFSLTISWGEDLLSQQNDTLSYFFWRQQGIKAMQKGNFDDAIDRFRLAKVLDDKPIDSDIEMLIDSAYNGHVRVYSLAKYN